MHVAPDELTPSAEQAVDGMRQVFLDAFRFTAGPGSACLAARAWRAWRARLLDLHGLPVAEVHAYRAASTELNGRARYAVMLWVTEGRLRRAARRASRAAIACA